MMENRENEVVVDIENKLRGHSGAQQGWKVK
jgi:hypothetical protein